MVVPPFNPRQRDSVCLYFHVGNSHTICDLSAALKLQDQLELLFPTGRYPEICVSPEPLAAPLVNLVLYRPKRGYLKMSFMDTSLSWPMFSDRRL